jgi:ABC-2 type transport system ATP-binding protein
MIRVENLVKTFGPKRAVDDISFAVERGEVLGFLGPNGAGKSTTMRIITGFYPPTAGRVSVGGHDIVDAPLPAKRLMGYLPENAPGYADMTVHGFLGFVADLRGLTGAAKKKAIDRAVETCFLEGVVHQTVDTLSKGYKHRTCLAQSILHDPDVLILDEPTDGLDPNQKHEVRGLIKRMGANKAIVFSTHILEEVELACTRVIIIDRGRIVASGTPAELKARGETAGAVRLAVRGRSADEVAAAAGAVAGAARVEKLGADTGHATVRVYPKTRGDATLAGAVTELARAQGWQVDELVTEEGRMDDVFRAITLPDTVRGASGQEARR